MKRACCLLIGLIIAATAFAQVQTQKGVSYRYNGKNPRTPLPNVTIDCKTANNVVNSDDTGSFTLTFNTLKMGDPIDSVTVRKPEMMVFNQHAVDDWSIRKEPLCLILCDADEFDRQKKEYMELGRIDAKRKYDREKAELEKQLEEGKIKQVDLEKALNVAYERLKKLQEEIDLYSDDLARIDLSELDDKMLEIIEMYQRGETEEAIERLKSLKLAEEFDKETAHNEAVQQELQKSDSKIHTLVEQMKNSVAILKNSGEWEEAGKYLKRIADKMNNYDALSEYAFFCQIQNNHQEAIDYYNRAFRRIDIDTVSDTRVNQFTRASILNDLANLYKDTQHYTESEAMYLEALKIEKLLAKSSPQTYEPGVAATLNNLAVLYNDTQRHNESEAIHLEALEIRRRLAKTNPQTYESDVASTLNNLAVLYKDTQRHKESEAMFLEALEIDKRLAQTDPQAYEPDVAMTLNNLACLYDDTQRYNESEALLVEALEIRRRLAQTNPQAYEPDVASTLNNLAVLYSKDAQRLPESEALFTEALEIRRRLAESNHQTYEPDVAETLNNLAILYKDTQRLTESEVLFLEALEIRKRLAEANPLAYELDVAQSLYNLASLYDDIQHYTESEILHLGTLEICRRLAQANPQMYEPHLAMALNNLARHYYATQRYMDSEPMFIEALEIYRRLAQSNPQVYEPNLAMILNNLANLYQVTQRLEESETRYLEALEIYRRLAQTNPQTYEPDIAQTLYHMGLLHIQMEQLLKAIGDFEDCLTIFRRLAQNNPAYESVYLSSLYGLTQLYPMTEEYAQCYEVNEEWLPILKVWYQKDVENLQKKYVKALGSHSFQCIFVGQYEKSAQYAREALAIDSTQHWISTNLAAALLLQGKYDEAEAIYRQYKDELKEGFLQDLQDFEAASVIPEERKAEVEKIRKLLNE